MRRFLTSYGRWLPPLVWMALIFVGSTDRLSASHTSRFVEPFLRWLFQGALSPQGVEEIHFLIRKAGHLCEYAVLGVLFWWSLQPAREAFAVENVPVIAARFQRRAVLTILLAACFAASDEFHQFFVPTRGASVEDALIDTIGAALGLSFVLAAGRLIRSVQRNGTRRYSRFPHG